jgi:hypothetical protein
MPVYHPLLVAVAKLVQEAPKPLPWVPTSMTSSMEEMLAAECGRPDPFDQIESKKSLYKRMKEGQITPLVLKQPNATLVALLDSPEQKKEIPFDLWSQIVQMFQRPDKRPYTIYFCANPAPRTFPKFGQVAQPFHINGGYTYPCDPNCVFLFRAEDATRVLIHELQHSACCDNSALHLEQREAETEAWAELLWTAFMSRGDLKKLEHLAKQQDAWSRSQNARLLRDKNFAPGAMGFPWRYTIGKTDIWKKWGLPLLSLLSIDSPTHPITSLRLTMPPTKAMKKMFGVSEKSMIL